MTKASGGSGRGRARRTKLEWGDDDLRNAYRTLNDRSGPFRSMVKAIDEDQWVTFHQLSDAALHPGAIADRLSVDLSTVLALDSPRRCLEQYDHDYDKVKRCLDGQEPP
jgi:hypothetical protein